MKEVLHEIDRWRAAGKRVAVARVVGLEGSGPRLPGATMAVTEGGEVAGSVSGGCVEGAVLTEALAVLADPAARPRLLTYGIADDDAFAVGLTCGGTIHVFVEALADDSTVFESLRRALREEAPIAVATVIEGALGQAGARLVVRPGQPPLGGLGDADLDRVVARDALGEPASGLTATRHYGPHGEARERDVSVFVESFGPPPHMVIFGAVDFTAALVKVAKVLGYRVTVCDARPAFATYLRFPEADEVVVGWPDAYLTKVGDELGPRDAVCVLTHDPKFDVPAVGAALDTDVGYLGAMGSRRTHADRLARLQHAGVDAARLHRLMAPIGLDIGARTPEETAVAICAEIIAVRTGRGGTSLRDREGPLHS
jgi:xanthine dehydrogenase accessory factor